MTAYVIEDQEDQLVFCSRVCIVNALEHGEDLTPKTIRVGSTVAKLLTCYCCGLTLHDAQVTP